MDLGVSLSIARLLSTEDERVILMFQWMIPSVVIKIFLDILVLRSWDNSVLRKLRLW